MVDLNSLVGHRVVVNSTDNAATWTGELVGIVHEPSLIVEQEDGLRYRVVIPLSHCTVKEA